MALKLVLSLRNCISSVRGSYARYSSVASSDNLIACWHPDTPILYEHTRPLPAGEAAADPGVLKKADLSSLRRAQPDEMVRQHLMDLTATTKHRWFPRSRDKKLRKRPVDREFL